MQKSRVRHPALRAVGAGAVALAAITAACSTRIASNLTSPSQNIIASPTTVTVPDAEKPMREFVLDSNTRLSPDSPRPKYPDALRGSGRDALLLAQVIVGRDGKAEPASLRIDTRGMQADDPFLLEARASLSTLEFEPAKVDGREVKQLVTLGFEFSGRKETSNVLVAAIPAGTNAPASQRPATRAPAVTDGQKAYFDFQVEQPAVMAPGSIGPKMPKELIDSKGDYNVLAQFVVDEAGKVDMSTFKVLKTSNALVAESVREALAAMQFTPALIGGKKVRQLLQQPFEFHVQ